MTQISVKPALEQPKIVVVVMGQDCSEYLQMCLPALKTADALVYCDGGSADESIAIAKSHMAEIIEQKYSQDDAEMNGKQRNFYLDYVKNKYPGWWCLALDADEIVDDLSVLKAKLSEFDPGRLYSVKMRHLIGNFVYEDATEQVHFVPNRLFYIEPCLFYPLGEHVVLEGKARSATDCVTIWHLAYAPLFHVRKRHFKNLIHSNAHKKDFLNWWYRAHLFDQYPKRKIDVRDLPVQLLDYYGIDKDELYFNARKIEAKHGIMVKQWHTYFQPKSVLALGCGLGPYLFFWDGYVPNIKGIEISKWAVEHSFVPGHVVQGDISTYVPDQQYDLVTAIDVLEHLDDTQLQSTLAMMAKTGQKFLFSIPFEGDCNLHNDPTHKQFHTKEAWIAMIGAHGIKVSDVPQDWLFHPQLLIGVNQNSR